MCVSLGMSVFSVCKRSECIGDGLSDSQSPNPHWASHRCRGGDGATRLLRKRLEDPI